jgi:hypothetical protein
MCMYWASWLCDKTLYLYSGSYRFESLPADREIKKIREFPQSYPWFRAAIDSNHTGKSRKLVNFLSITLDFGQLSIRIIQGNQENSWISSVLPLISSNYRFESYKEIKKIREFPQSYPWFRAVIDSNHTGKSRKLVNFLNPILDFGQLSIRIIEGNQETSSISSVLPLISVNYRFESYKEIKKIREFPPTLDFGSYRFESYGN